MTRRLRSETIISDLVQRFARGTNSLIPNRLQSNPLTDRGGRPTPSRGEEGQRVRLGHEGGRGRAELLQQERLPQVGHLQARLGQGRRQHRVRLEAAPPRQRQGRQQPRRGGSHHLKGRLHFVFDWIIKYNHTLSPVVT